METCILIIEMTEMFRKGICRLLSQIPWVSALYETGDLTEGLALLKEQRPDILIADPFDKTDPEGFIRSVKTASPGTKIVILTDSDYSDNIVTAAKCGIKGYFLKNTSFSEFEAGLFSIARGGYGVTLSLSVILFKLLSSLQNHDVLTSREKSVYELMKLGYSNKEIAKELYISIYTVKNHISSIMKKYNLKTRYQIGPHESPK